MSFPKKDKYAPELQKLSAQCSALGFPARLELLVRLTQDDLYVNDLVATMPISQGAVSSHLAKLRKTGIVDVAIEGLYNKYSFDIGRLEDVRDALNAFIARLKDAKNGADGACGDENGNRQSGG